MNIVERREANEVISKDRVREAIKKVSMQNWCRVENYERELLKELGL